MYAPTPIQALNPLRGYEPLTMVQVGRMMSVPDNDGCYCKKCGALVDPTDEKCPNGHVLAEVGRHFVRSASARIVFNASEAVITKLNQYKDLYATLTVKQKDEYLDEMNKNLEIIKDQTRPKSWPEKIKDKIIDNLLSYVILLLIGYLVAILSS